ncbi:hypothetical protein EPUL_002304 [Erysiphe pulchra]|uniref:Tf2-1-like SH3-like domain-containing protein n=1 Tax=Erysiphe pulchra TaxID=225359 RepID=A0A2S4PRI0_9PEZI|nr:hypothetical protein EPUL_002304 [Erysiphe pulchra]
MPAQSRLLEKGLAIDEIDFKAIGTEIIKDKEEIPKIETIDTEVDKIVTIGLKDYRWVFPIQNRDAMNDSFPSSGPKTIAIPSAQKKPKVEDMVFISLKNLNLSRTTKKLDHMRAGPWRITKKKSPLVAKLDLPHQIKVDNNFHISLLRPAYIGYPSQYLETPPPLEIAPSGHEVNEVEAIL